LLRNKVPMSVESKSFCVNWCWLENGSGGRQERKKSHQLALVLNK